jgi:hypothetical protein
MDVTTIQSRTKNIFNPKKTSLYFPGNAYSLNMTEVTIAQFCMNWAECSDLDFVSNSILFIYLFIYFVVLRFEVRVYTWAIPPSPFL